jgi:glycerate dehydrogenase
MQNDERETEEIVFLDRGSLRAKLRPAAFPMRWKDYEQTEAGDVVTRLADATVAIINKVRLPREVLASLPKLKLIAVAATGTDVIDLEACRDLNIAVTNVRGYAVNSLPEHVFALILALRRSLNFHREAIDAGQWTDSKQFCVFSSPMHDLAGSTLGLIGFGSLGRSVASLGLAFGMKIKAFDHYPIREPNVERASLDDILSDSDVISLHVPLTATTRNIISSARIKQMKRSAILINTARGGLVDETALATALQEGLIAGAGIDVLAVEPPPADSPLLGLKLPNLILTPHVAWASEEAMQLLADQLIDNIEAFMLGKPQNLVVGNPLTTTSAK